MKNNYS